MMSVCKEHITPNICSAVTKNEIILNFDTEMLRRLQNNQWNQFSHHLKDTFKIELAGCTQQKKLIVSENAIDCLEKCLNFVVPKLDIGDKEMLEAVLEILRLLRNCSPNLKTQNYIIGHTNLLRIMDTLFSKFFEVDANNICLKVLFQFLINLSSSNKKATKEVSDIFCDKIKICLKNNINVYESSALMYNIALLVKIRDTELINIIFDIYDSTNTNEFVIFYLEQNISSSHFWSIYRELKLENKIATLEILEHMQLRKHTHNLPLMGLEVLTNIFLESVDIIFQVKLEDSNSNMKIYEVSLILEIISSLSSDERYLEKLQSNKDILINTGVILINIHRLGKVSNNCFTPIQKLSEFRKNSVLKENAAFGFKADLVRLIGNLCWRHKHLQNLARTAELIPIILECCNMDARNPFIMQWAILAVRNLCEDNQENQKVIAGLHREGTVSSEELREMGITLHADGESDLKIVPLDALKK